MNNYDCEDMRQEEMLCRIKEYKFSIIELGLYLDTHPEDEKALCFARQSLSGRKRTGNSRCTFLYMKGCETWLKIK